MLEELDDLPEGVIGFEAVGTIHSDDYVRVLRPAVESATERGGIRLVYVFGHRFEGYSSGAAWEDTKLGLGNDHSWERIAIVSDHDWAEHLVKVFGWMIPGEVRLFGVGTLPEAIDWAGEGVTGSQGDR